MIQIDISSTIIISTNYKKVFEYVSNYSNDVFWRKEINAVKINTESVEKNTLIIEDSFLSKKTPNYISKLKCIEFQKYELIISETIFDNSFWAKNTRIVEVLPNGSTKLTYRVQFDINIVKHGLGFSLPKFIVNFYTKSTMNKYLSVLKNILEIKINNL